MGKGVEWSSPRVNPWAFTFNHLRDDLPQSLSNSVLMFTDDTKLIRTIQSIADHNQLQIACYNGL